MVVLKLQVAAVMVVVIMYQLMDHLLTVDLVDRVVVLQDSLLLVAVVVLQVVLVLEMLVDLQLDKLVAVVVVLAVLVVLLQPQMVQLVELE